METYTLESGLQAGGDIVTDNNGDSHKIIDYVTNYAHIAGTPPIINGYDTVNKSPYARYIINSMIDDSPFEYILVRKGQSIGMSSGVIDSVVRYFIDHRDCHPETFERLDGE